MHWTCAASHHILEDIGHVRELLGENQKALSCIVRVLTQIQDHVRLLNENMAQWVAFQSSPAKSPSGGGVGMCMCTTYERVRVLFYR